MNSSKVYFSDFRTTPGGDCLTRKLQKLILKGGIGDHMHEPGFCDHHDHFKNSQPDSEWQSCLEHAEKIGLGSRKYELVR